MTLRRHTKSFCCTCYAEIPALIEVLPDGAWMTKACPVHGETRAMVERDPIFYAHVMGLNARMIYPGMFIEVTRRCNLRCTFCYQDLLKTDPVGEYTLEKILNECRVNMDNAPFILTGGEPTFRDDIVEVLTEVRKISPVTPRMLSNGVRLVDRKLYEGVLGQLWDDQHHVFGLNLSIHAKETDTWKVVLGMLRADKVKIESILVVVESKEEFLEAVRLAHEYADVIGAMRIHAATPIYADAGKAIEKIFVSDMLKWLEEAGENPVAIANSNNKSCFFNVTVSGVWLMIVSWFELPNIDLPDIDVPPRYRAKNGACYNLVTWAVVNEGWDKGWLFGKRIATEALRHGDSNEHLNSKRLAENRAGTILEAAQPD